MLFCFNALYFLCKNYGCDTVAMQAVILVKFPNVKIELGSSSKDEGTQVPGSSARVWLGFVDGSWCSDAWLIVKCN